MSERTYTGWFAFALVFLVFAGVFAVLALLAEGDADAAADAAIEFANLAALVGVAFVLLPAGVEACYQLHEYTGWGEWLSDDGQSFEVVVTAFEDEEGARLLRNRLLDDGFHDHAVEVREADSDA